MAKPINVEAQRIQRVLSETQANLKVLSLLSCDLFSEIGRKQPEELVATWGEEIGNLLSSQADCEEKFENVNCPIESLRMERLDSDLFDTKFQKNEAIRNAKTIQSNILKLIHTFRRDDMQAKLTREFRDTINRPQTNEIQGFAAQFEKTKSLWNTKLATSLEEYNRMQEQVESSSKRVKELNDQLKNKKENLDKYVKESKEAKEQARIEIENLKKGRQDLNQEKFQLLNNLVIRGKALKDAQQQHHEQTMVNLQRTIEDLNAELLQVKAENTAKEKQLLTSYDGADKQYTEALESYDTEMREKNKERDEQKADLDDHEQQLAQIREQWAERVEEKRRREDLAEIIRRKEEKQKKHMDTLNKAAQFLQAHYRGMLARRDMEKARKGKKRKGRKK